MCGQVQDLIWIKLASGWRDEKPVSGPQVKSDEIEIRGGYCRSCTANKKILPVRKIGVSLLTLRLGAAFAGHIHRQRCSHEPVKVAVQNALGVGGFKVGTQVLDHLVRLQNI
jgi:hypothetical protein